MHKTTIHTLRVFHIAIFHFLGESIGIEPRQQLHIHRYSQIAVLRSMHMQIIHSRHQHLIAEVHQLYIRVLIWQ